MAFIDNLALVEVLLLVAASLLVYIGVNGWWAMRKNDPKGLRNVLKGGAVPLGVVGGASMVLALWGEMAWPYPTGMQGYNIFFGDVFLLFSIVMVAYAIGITFSIRLQYLGVLAFVAGAVTLFYGWTGWTANPAYTKDPFDTFLLYAGFGAAGIFAFPASVIVDLYLAAAEGNSTFWTSVVDTNTSFRSTLGLSALGVRGVGAVIGEKPVSKEESEATRLEQLKFRMPILAQLIVLLFPVFMFLAGVAAFYYFGTTLPGHLGNGAAKAP